LEAEKQSIRRDVWDKLEKAGVTLYPKPVVGRIPNFVGAKDAAERLRRSKVYRSAKVLKVNPDAPQRPVREMALKDGKTLIMPTPRLRGGFLILENISRNLAKAASFIGGMFRYGRSVKPWDLPAIDIIVIGSVAVSRDGWRLGKGEGYAELEYAILREFGKVRDDTPVYTTVHDLQIVDMIPHTDYDLPVDMIYTSTGALECLKQPRPKGIIWEMLDSRKIAVIPMLAELLNRRKT
jgi:5-formyltetrahydrofolate cyclo-ligase